MREKKSPPLGARLRDYFKENGLQMKWFAEKLGMSKQQLYQIMSGRTTLPRIYWERLIQLTNEKITLADILSDILKNVEEIEIKSGESAQRCEVSLHNINK